MIRIPRMERSHHFFEGALVANDLTIAGKV